MNPDIEPNVQAWVPAWSVQLDDHPTALCWRADGELLAASSLAGEAVVLDATDGAQVRAPVHHGGGTLCVAWRGAQLVTGGQDGDITIDGERDHVGGWVNALAVSDGAEVAIAHGRNVSIAGSSVLATHTTTITSLSWHPIQRLVAAASFGRVSWVSTDDGSTDDVELQWGGAVATLCMAPDSGWGAAGVRGDWGYAWQVDQSLPALALPIGTSTGRHVGFSADGSQLAFATPQMSAVFDLASPDPLGQPAGQWLSSVGRPTALCWHPTTELLVTAVSSGAGQRDHGLLSWQPRRSPLPLAFISTPAEVTHLIWSPDGTTLGLATVDGTVGAAPNPFDLG